MELDSLGSADGARSIPSGVCGGCVVRSMVTIEELLDLDMMRGGGGYGFCLFLFSGFWHNIMMGYSVLLRTVKVYLST